MKMKSIFGSILAICLAVIPSSCGKEDNNTPDHTSFYEEIHYLNKMEFASLALTKTVKTDRSDWYKIGKRIAVYSYDTHLRATIDLSLLTPEDIQFDEKTKTARITLPDVKVEIAGMDMQLRKEYENIGMFRSEIGADERARMKEKANEALMNELKQNPEYKRKLVETARDKARVYFETLFSNAGYTASVSFRGMKDSDRDALIDELK